MEWKQIEIIHCPNIKCKGMLLENDLCFELKCSQCNKYYIFDTSLVETTEPNKIKQ